MFLSSLRTTANPYAAVSAFPVLYLLLCVLRIKYIVQCRYVIIFYLLFKLILRLIFCVVVLGLSGGKCCCFHDGLMIFYVVKVS